MALDSFQILGAGLGKKEGKLFLRVGFDTLMHTVILVITAMFVINGSSLH